MTTPLDLGLLKAFSDIFILLLVFAVFAGALNYTKVIPNAALSYLIAALIAFISVLFAPGVSELIKFMLPWMAVVMILGMVLLTFVKFAGGPEITEGSDPLKTLGIWVGVILIFIIFLAGISKIYLSEGAPAAARDLISEADLTPEDKVELTFWKTFFHPNVMGLILVLLIAVFALVFLTGND